MHANQITNRRFWSTRALVKKNTHTDRTETKEHNSQPFFESVYWRHGDTNIENFSTCQQKRFTNFTDTLPVWASMAQWTEELQKTDIKIERKSARTYTRKKNKQCQTYQMVQSFKLFRNVKNLKNATSTSKLLAHVRGMENRHLQAFYYSNASGM